MNILVINAGSSSIKYQLIDMTTERPLSSGLVERIGLPEGIINHKTFIDGSENKITETYSIPDHTVGLKRVAELLTTQNIGVISDPSEIKVVGHRLVHGGEAFSKTIVINKDVKEKIKELFPLAPLHNPANLIGIEVAEHVFPNATQVGVFDTAFHQTIPEVANRYGIPNQLYTKFRIRKYGFHGTSHKYVSEKASAYLKSENAKIVTIHLGNGASIAAVNAGKSIDTSMGIGTLNGLIMGTRSGDIDPSIIFFLVKELGYSIDEVIDILNKESGMKGLTGNTDMRDIIKRINKGDREAILAYNIYAYRIKSFIGSYAAAMNGLDAIVFTAGIGENDPLMRKLVCKDMDFLGIEMDEKLNLNKFSQVGEINTKNSKTKVLVIPTNEELEIAKQSFILMNQ